MHFFGFFNFCVFFDFCIFLLFFDVFFSIFSHFFCEKSGKKAKKSGFLLSDSQEPGKCTFFALFFDPVFLDKDVKFHVFLIFSLFCVFSKSRKWDPGITAEGGIFMHILWVRKSIFCHFLLFFCYFLTFFSAFFCAFFVKKWKNPVFRGKKVLEKQIRILGFSTFRTFLHFFSLFLRKKIVIFSWFFAFFCKKRKKSDEATWIGLFIFYGSKTRFLRFLPFWGVNFPVSFLINVIFIVFWRFFDFLHLSKISCFLQKSIKSIKMVKTRSRPGDPPFLGVFEKMRFFQFFGFLTFFGDL